MPNFKNARFQKAMALKTDTILQTVKRPKYQNSKIGKSQTSKIPKIHKIGNHQNTKNSKIGKTGPESAVALSEVTAYNVTATTNNSGEILSFQTVFLID